MNLSAELRQLPERLGEQSLSIRHARELTAALRPIIKMDFADLGARGPRGNWCAQHYREQPGDRAGADHSPKSHPRSAVPVTAQKSEVVSMSTIKFPHFFEEHLPFGHRFFVGRLPDDLDKKSRDQFEVLWCLRPPERPEIVIHGRKLGSLDGSRPTDATTPSAASQRRHRRSRRSSRRSLLGAVRAIDRVWTGSC